MSRASLRLGAVLVIGALTIAPRVSAQDADLERARALFEEAGELERRGDYTTAQERLGDALRIRETPHLRYALGWALENDDKLVAARTQYETALRLAERTGAEEVRRLATTRLLELERITPVLQIRLAEPKLDVAMVDDRAIVARSGAFSSPVDPGTHRVRVERAGGGVFEQRVFVPRAVVRVIDMSNVRIADRSTPETLPWMLVGGGATLIIGGVALFAWSTSDAASRDDKMQRWCDATACVNGDVATRPETPATTALRTDAAADADRGNAKQVAGAVLGGIGVVSTGIGLYMLLRAHEPRDARGVRVSGSPLPGGGAASAAVAF